MSPRCTPSQCCRMQPAAPRCNRIVPPKEAQACARQSPRSILQTVKLRPFRPHIACQADPIAHQDRPHGGRKWVKDVHEVEEGWADSGDSCVWRAGPLGRWHCRAYRALCARHLLVGGSLVSLARRKQFILELWTRARRSRRDTRQRLRLITFCGRLRETQGTPGDQRGDQRRGTSSGISTRAPRHEPPPVRESRNASFAGRARPTRASSSRRQLARNSVWRHGVTRSSHAVVRVILGPTLCQACTTASCRRQCRGAKNHQTPEPTAVPTVQTLSNMTCEHYTLSRTYERASRGTRGTHLLIVRHEGTRTTKTTDPRRGSPFLAAQLYPLPTRPSTQTSGLAQRHGPSQKLVCLVRSLLRIDSRSSTTASHAGGRWALVTATRRR